MGALASMYIVSLRDSGAIQDQRVIVSQGEYRGTTFFYTTTSITFALCSMHVLTHLVPCHSRTHHAEGKAFDIKYGDGSHVSGVTGMVCDTIYGRHLIVIADAYHPMSSNLLVLPLDVFLGSHDSLGCVCSQPVVRYGVR